MYNDLNLHRRRISMNRQLIYLVSVTLVLLVFSPMAWAQEPVNQIIEPEFNNNLDGWGQYGSAGYNIEVVRGAGLSGANAAVIDITDASAGTAIGLSLDGLLLETGVTYPIGFMARAEQDREMVLLIQTNLNNTSWPSQLTQTVQLTTVTQSYEFEYTHSADTYGDDAGETVSLYLMLKGSFWPMAGDALNRKVWFDRVYFGAEPKAALIAEAPVPGDGDVDVRPNVVLSWTPSLFADTHDVYFGTSFEDVNSAGRSTADILISQAQDANAINIPGVFALGQTYYWRVDEVNAAPDNTIYRGDVWSFTAEPVSYPIANLSVTASSSHSEEMLPEKTIDGSGLDALDQHSSGATDMWLSSAGVQPVWIQYEFDAIYKLHEMWIWNSNQLIESFVGLGAKDVTIETSVDGVEWTELTDVPQFAQAPGRNGYPANTTVNFAGTMAKHVRLNINAGYGMLPQSGLSEVRFFYVPTHAREPQPGDGVLMTGADVQLTWRVGREAVSHQVNLGMDASVLDLVATTTEPSYAANGLNYGTTYFWSITEVNEAEAVSSYTGDIWSFTTPEFGTVDDFDQYDDSCNRIFFTWEDGLGHNGGTEIDNCDVPPSNGNGGGSIVGNAQPPFAEKTIVQSGGQSLPLEYDNAFGPSETTLSIDAQDWTASGVQTLSLFFYGQADNSGQLYVKINNSKLSYDGGIADITRAQWQPWNIDLTGLNGLQNVTSLTIGIDGATAAGLLYIDSIRLYPQALEYVTPTEPDNASLVGLWSFDEGNGTVALDSSGNGHDGSFDNVQRVSGKLGGALQFGSGDPLDCGDVLTLTEAITIACWVNPADLLGEKSFVTRHGAYVLKSSGNFLRFTTPGVYDYSSTSTLLEAGVWQHVAISFVPNQADGAVFYLNGVETQRLNHSGGTTSGLPAGTGPFQIGNNQWDQFFSGAIDEVHVYDQPLSSGEIAWLAGKTEPMHKPL
jgi:hypothetical protein